MANPVARSMTGFAQKSFELDGLNLIITIKSLNAKGLDISFKSSSQELVSLEPFVRDYIKTYIKRGTVFVFVDLKSSAYVNQIVIKHLKAIVKDLEEFKIYMDLELSADKIFDIAMEIYKNSEIIDSGKLDTIKCFFKEVFKEFLCSKEKEGEFLLQDIRSRIGLLEKYLQEAIEKFRDYETSNKEKVIEKARTLGLEEHNPVLINELMFILQRLDVSEELARIQNHINHLLEIMFSKDLEKGKKIDFITQELHREITTMSNKVPELSYIAVNMKYETDKIKQQCANLE